MKAALSLAALAAAGLALYAISQQAGASVAPGVDGGTPAPDAGNDPLAPFLPFSIGDIFGVSPNVDDTPPAGVDLTPSFPDNATGAIMIGSPRGLRQHNPGNLRSWGSVPVVNGFASFPNDAAGLSAMAGNLLAYYKRGLNTLRGIINRWAPPADHNDTSAYVKTVSQATGFGPDDVLNLNDPGTLAAIMGAMIHEEQGQQPFSMAALQSAAQSRIG